MFKLGINKNVILVVVGLILLNGLFFPVAIPERLSKAVAMITNVYLVLLYLQNRKSAKGALQYAAIILWLVLATLVTTYAFNDQSPSYTIYAIYKWFDICLCFFLLSRQVSKDELYKGLMVFCIIWGLLYIYAAISVPEVKFHGGYEDSFEEEQERGWFRIYIKGMQYHHIFLYWSIFRYLNTQKRLYLCMSLLAFVLILSSLSRQHILITTALSLFIFIKDLPWKKKIAIMGVSAFVMLYYIPKTSIYQNMIELTEYQMERNNGGQDDIRIEAYKYYLGYNDSNVPQILLGNGFQYGESVFGQEIRRIIYTKGYVLADVGGAYFYFHFGILGSIIFLWVLIKIFKSSGSNDNAFIKYYIVAAVAGTIFSNLLNSSMGCISIVLYLLYLDSKENNYIVQSYD